MNRNRKELLEKIFANISDGKESCTIEKLKYLYNYNKNASYMTGEKTKEETFALFLKSFNVDFNKDEMVFY